MVEKWSAGESNPARDGCKGLRGTNRAPDRHDPKSARPAKDYRLRVFVFWPPLAAIHRPTEANSLLIVATSLFAITSFTF
jgi:hypothetical protein